MVEVVEVRVVVAVVVVWRHCFGDLCLAISAAAVEAGDPAAAGVVEAASAAADLVAVVAASVEVSAEAGTSEVEVLVGVGKAGLRSWVFGLCNRRPKSKDLSEAPQNNYG